MSPSRRASTHALAVVVSALNDARAALEGETSERVTRQLRRDLESLAMTAGEIARAIDPVFRPAQVFDPSHPKVSSHIVSLALMAQPRRGLSGLGKFYGAGVYAIYYRGAFEPYSEISGTEQPIYVGRARPVVNGADSPDLQGTALFSRLGEHARSINSAENIRVDDFDARFLVVKSGGESACEDYLIPLFRPIWNTETKVCHGIGKHGDSPHTRGNKRSPWDTMHPGRRWADEITSDQKSIKQITEDIEKHFSVHPPLGTIEEVMKEIVGGLEQFARTDLVREEDAAGIPTSLVGGR